MLNLNTPVEEHNLNGRKILVKRDNLMGDNNILPPWGKMAGIDALLENLNPKYPLIHYLICVYKEALNLSMHTHHQKHIQNLYYVKQKKMIVSSTN